MAGVIEFAYLLGILPLIPAFCGSLPQVLLNILADEIHRAHQRCLFEAECDPNKVRAATPPLGSAPHFSAPASRPAERLLARPWYAKPRTRASN